MVPNFEKLAVMNRISILLASLSLVSCATKPWMVGSANDSIKPAKVPGGVWTKDFVAAGAGTEEAAPVYDSGKSSKNPLPLNMGAPFRNL
jgi:hypothetical protein